MTESAPPSSPDLVWHCRPFPALTPAWLHGALALRAAVFVVEQRCAYGDPDGFDPRALYVVGIDTASAAPAGVVAHARILLPGTRFTEPSIGRVCVAASHRRRGTGRELMRVAIDACRRAHPGRPIRISAQSYLDRFYRELGFEPASEPYDEDGIPHREMLLPAARTADGEAPAP